jgi:hypothetical protein
MRNGAIVLKKNDCSVANAGEQNTIEESQQNKQSPINNNENRLMLRLEMKR